MTIQKIENLRQITNAYQILCKLTAQVLKNKSSYCSLKCTPQNRPAEIKILACSACGKPVKRHAERVKWFRRAFCSQACYHSVRQDGKYVPWRQGQRIARQVVSKYFDLKPEHIVHHEDKDNSHNYIANLLVFASQADHMAYHHGSDVKPLWDGRMLSQGVTL